jgi:aminopeptidase N
MRRVCFVALLLALALPDGARAQDTVATFTHADTIRGSNTPQRAWWDASFYDLHVTVNPADSSIRGWNAITYRVLKTGEEMQIDLQVPLDVDSIVQDGQSLAVRRDSNAFFVSLAAPQRVGSSKTVTVWYHGKPRVATHAPWDGGFVWARDSVGNPWFVTANEGLGASVWWPNKDYLADEPDSQRVAITVPDSTTDVSNGRLRKTTPNGDGTTTWEWFVRSPINNYNVTVNAGHYAHFSDTYQGAKGKLTLDFWPMAYHADTARKQFAQVKPMLACFEKWFGPFPWYEDGYKLVETPHLGMEHQSAVAYGNHYKNGYLGKDLSGTGHGLKWDFIIVHESAHEWWGNNISMKDQADMWIHEGFANYAEALYTECQEGKKAGAEYVLGVRENIANDKPIVSAYGVNSEGSGDMYYKGGNMLHTIRQIVNDDAKWRSILRGLQSTFRRQTVTGRQVQDYISRRAGVNLSKVFEQYLTTTTIPALEYKIEGRKLSYRWSDAVPGFDMPVRVKLSPAGWTLVRPTASWKTATLRFSDPASFAVDENFYVIPRHVTDATAADSAPTH